MQEQTALLEQLDNFNFRFNIMKISETKIKEKLEKLLNRKPKKNEIINAQTDFNITNEILFDEVELLKIEIINLKK